MRKYFLLFITTIIAISAYAQQADSLAELLMNRAIMVRNFGRSLPQEKVYMHLDNTSYYQGDKIWFQCYVVTADKNKPTDLSKTLYVELLNPEGIVIEKLPNTMFKVRHTEETANRTFRFPKSLLDKNLWYISGRVSFLRFCLQYMLSRYLQQHPHLYRR